MANMKRKKIDYTKYALAFFITIFVFIIGISVGDNLNEAKLDQVTELNEDIRATTLAIQTQFDLVSENSCEFVNDTYLFDELLDVSERVEFMENQLGQQNPQVKRLKEYYSTLLIKYWLFTKDTRENCQDNKVQYIIYFYSSKEACPFCDSQGYILSNIRKDNPNIRIFAFDYTLNNAALNTLKKMFITDLERFPILIINENEAHQGFMSRVSIERDLGIANETLN